MADVIKISGGHEFSTQGQYSGSEKRNWVYKISYCGPTIGKEKYENACNFFSISITSPIRSKFYSLEKWIGSERILSRSDRDLERVQRRAIGISRGIAKLVLKKLVPKDLRDKVEIVEDLRDWKTHVKDLKKD